MKFLEKLRSQPDGVKKMILWATVLLIGTILVIFLVLDMKGKIKKLEKEDLQNNIKGNLQEFKKAETENQ